MKKDSKSILYVIGALDRGGAELHLYRVLPILKNRYGYKPFIYCLTNSGELIENFTKLNIPVFMAPIKASKNKSFMLFRLTRLMFAAVKLWYIQIKLNPKIVHYFLPLSYLIGLPTSFAAGKTNLIMSRRSLNIYQNNVSGSNFIERIYHKFIKVILANSEAVKQNLLEENAPIEKIKLIYNGVEVLNHQKIKISNRENLKIKKTTLLFTIVANLIPYKGHKFLLESLFLIKEKISSEWRLLIIGEDRGIKQTLANHTKKLNLEKNILWYGSIEDTYPILVDSDIGILSSEQEGFSNSILESMAAELPMVVTDVGGNSEAVIDGETGYVVPYGDTSKMSESLLKLANNSDLRKSMGVKGKQRVKELFTIEKCVAKYDHLYNAILEKKPLPDLDNNLIK